MKLFRFAWKEFTGEIWKRIPMILQMACILFIITGCVTSVYSRYRYLISFEDYWKKDGVTVWTTTYKKTEEQLRDSLVGEKDILFNYRYTGLKLNIPHPYIYDDALITAFQPDLLDGDWVRFKKNKPLPQVMVNAGSGYQVGDIIEIWQVVQNVTYEYNDPNDPNKITNVITDINGNAMTEWGAHSLQVAGVFDDTTMLLAFNGSAVDAGLLDYRQLFSEVDSLQSEGDTLTVIMSESEALKLFTEDMYSPQGIGLVTFEDGVDDDSHANNREVIRSAAGKNVLSKMWENRSLLRESRIYCYQQAYALLPIFIGVLILFIISLISVNTVSATGKQRTYMVYRICGLRLTECAWISGFKTLIDCVLAAAICSVLMLIKNQTNLLQGFLVTFGIHQMVICALFILLNVLLSTLICNLVLRHGQIRQILKES